VLDFMLIFTLIPLAGCIETKTSRDRRTTQADGNKRQHHRPPDLVIQDARQNVEKINGEKPTNVVRPRTSVCLRGGRGGGSSEARNTKHETRNTKQDARDYVQAALLRRQSHARLPSVQAF